MKVGSNDIVHIEAFAVFYRRYSLLLQIFALCIALRGDGYITE